MENSQDIERRLLDLEVKASFADDLLEQLNQIIVRQQQQIDRLQREVADLRQQAPRARRRSAACATNCRRIIEPGPASGQAHDAIQADRPGESRPARMDVALAGMAGLCRQRCHQARRDY